MNDFNEETFVTDKNTNWYYISIYQKLSEKFIEKHKDKVYWIWISVYQILSEKFIEKYKDEVDWYYISQYQNLSEKFIEKYIDKYIDKVNWYYISQSQILSEKFIEKYKDKVNWYCISIYQKLSEQFIEKHKDKVCWFNISKYQILSKKFIEKHNLQISKYNWLYKTKKEKLNYIKQNTDYKVINNKYIIAYKSVRDDYKSVIFPNKYKYEIGKTYESNCDCNINEENSFGLSAWTKHGMLDYYSKGKLLLVKINIEDIGAIIKKNNKIRCFKLTVLEKIE